MRSLPSTICDSRVSLGALNTACRWRNLSKRPCQPSTRPVDPPPARCRATDSIKYSTSIPRTMGVPLARGQPT